MYTAIATLPCSRFLVLFSFTMPPISVSLNSFRFFSHHGIFVFVFRLTLHVIRSDVGVDLAPRKKKDMTREFSCQA